MRAGDVVFLRDHELHRNRWPLGVIESIYPSEDGKVRSVEVRVVQDGKTSNFVRPITELIRLID